MRMERYMKAKRFLALLLCLALLCGLMPAVLAEAEEITFAEDEEITESASTEEEAAQEPAESNEAADEFVEENEDPSPEIADDELDDAPLIDSETETDGEELEAVPEDFPFALSAVLVNPLYGDLFSEESGALPTDSARAATFNAAPDDAAAYVSPDTASRQIAEYMISRTASYDIKIKFEKTGDLWLIVYNATLNAANLTSGPKGGDSLAYQFGKVNYSVSSYKSDDSYYYAVINCQPVYYTTAAQEAELDSRVSAIASQLNLTSSSLSDYEKICLIYDYVCTNVVYDTAHQGQTGTYLHYTPYGALCQGTAVCQGIGLAVFRLCWAAGISKVQLVTSTSMDHAWNIIAPEGAEYYYCDATWDLQRSGTGMEKYLWFMRGTEFFSVHHGSDLGDSSPMTYVKTDEGKLRYTRSRATAVFNISAKDYGPAHSETLTAPELSLAQSAEGCISLSWNAVAYADSYRVFYREGKESWQELAVTALTEYEFTDAQAGTVYTFNVRALADFGAKVGPYAVAKGIICLKTPAIFSCEDAVNAAAIKWNQSPGASAYEVYYRPSGELSWTLYTRTKLTEVTVKGLAKGVCYELAVCACASGFTSPMPESGTFFTPNAPSSLEAPELSLCQQSEGSITLQWNAVDGADSYRIFFREGKNPWQQLCDTNGRIYSFNSAQAGKVYTFTVRALAAGGRVASAQSVAKGIICLTTPQISKLVKTEKGATIKWNATPGASAYSVYTRVKGGDWVLRATTRGTELEIAITEGISYCEICVLSRASGYLSPFPTSGTIFTR